MIEQKRWKLKLFLDPVNIFQSQSWKASNLWIAIVLSRPVITTKQKWSMQKRASHDSAPPSPFADSFVAVVFWCLFCCSSALQSFCSSGRSNRPTKRGNFSGTVGQHAIVEVDQPVIKKTFIKRTWGCLDTIFFLYFGGLWISKSWEIVYRPIFNNPSKSLSSKWVVMTLNAPIALELPRVLICSLRHPLLILGNIQNFFRAWVVVAVLQ